MKTHKQLQSNLRFQREFFQEMHTGMRRAQVSRYLRFCLLSLLILMLMLPLEAAQPAWWNQILEDPEAPPNIAENYAPVNHGQLKHVALQAQAHLDQTLPGGAGFSISDLWSEITVEENYAPINVGQLKVIAKPFYDRLIAIGYDTKENLIDRGYSASWTSDYPWPTDGSVPMEDNYAPANIGQLKLVFSFDVTFSSDSDGLPDWWELHYFGNLNPTGGDPAPGDPSLTLAEAYALGRNPHVAALPEPPETTGGLVALEVYTRL